MYAIIQTGGKQYRVSPGDVIRVENLGGEKGATVDFPVLAVAQDNETLQAGKGVKARASATILNQGREKKVIVFKFKRKKQHKKTAGHRQGFTTVKIGEIS